MEVTLYFLSRLPFKFATVTGTNLNIGTLWPIVRNPYQAKYLALPSSV